MDEQAYRLPNLVLSFQLTIKSDRDEMEGVTHLRHATTRPRQLPSTIRKSYGNPLNFQRHGRWKSRRSVRSYRCTVVRSRVGFATAQISNRRG